MIGSIVCWFDTIWRNWRSTGSEPFPWRYTVSMAILYVVSERILLASFIAVFMLTTPMVLTRSGRNLSLYGPLVKKLLGAPAPTPAWADHASPRFLQELLPPVIGVPAGAQWLFT